MCVGNLANQISSPLNSISGYLLGVMLAFSSFCGLLLNTGSAAMVSFLVYP